MRTSRLEVWAPLTDNFPFLCSHVDRLLLDSSISTELSTYFCLIPLFSTIVPSFNIFYCFLYPPGVQCTFYMLEPLKIVHKTFGLFCSEFLFRFGGKKKNEVKLFDEIQIQSNALSFLSNIRLRVKLGVNMGDKERDLNLFPQQVNRERNWRVEPQIMNNKQGPWFSPFNVLHFNWFAASC